MVVTMGMKAKDGAADVKSGRAEMQAWVMWRLKAGLLGIAVLLLWCAAAAASAKVGAAPRRKGASHPHHTLPPTVTALLSCFSGFPSFRKKAKDGLAGEPRVSFNAGPPRVAPWFGRDCHFLARPVLSWLSQKATSPLCSSRTGETLRCSSAALAGGDPAADRRCKWASSGCAGGYQQHHARCWKRIRPQLPRPECRTQVSVNVMMLRRGISRRQQATLKGTVHCSVVSDMSLSIGIRGVASELPTRTTATHAHTDTFSENALPVKATSLAPQTPKAPGSGLPRSCLTSKLSRNPFPRFPAPAKPPSPPHPSAHMTLGYTGDRQKSLFPPWNLAVTFLRHDYPYIYGLRALPT
ncbi:hypothetical protein L1887_56994 [Cichorium endivia]|nr:hypothetical protein L1887_56994 [Cichorium endivia]